MRRGSYRACQGQTKETLHLPNVGLCVMTTHDRVHPEADDGCVIQSEALRRARQAAARRHHLLTTGRPRSALIVAARPTGALDGVAALVELDLELSETAEEPRRRIKVVESVPLVLASRALAGLSIDVFVAFPPEDDVLVEWSA